MSERHRGAPGHVSPEVLIKALTEHAAPERLVVARGLFAGPSAQVPDDMYARIVRGKAHRERNALHLEHGATVDTNTYFGRLPASYFQRWTTVTEVQLKLVFDTSSPARLLLKASDSGGTARTVATTEVDGTGTAVIVGSTRRVRRRRRAVDGMHRGGRRARGSPTSNGRSPAPPTIRPAADHHLHLQPGRRLRDHRRRRRRRQGPAGRHRRGLRRRPGHRRRRDQRRCSTTSPHNSATSWCTSASRTWVVRRVSPAACTKCRASPTTRT